MALTRSVRRKVGMLARNLPEGLFDVVSDPRGRRGRRWPQVTLLLKTIVVGLMVGCKGLLDVEELTAAMPADPRRVLGIRRRVPDTTLRELVCKLNVQELCRVLEIVGYSAWRRKAFHSLEGFEFGAVSMDGKCVSIADTGEHAHLQVRHDESGQPTDGLLRTITSALVTAEGRPIISAAPVPGETNEDGVFEAAFQRLLRVYDGLFQLVMYDAGAASEKNAEIVVAAGKQYLFCVVDERRQMHQMIEMLTRDKQPVASREDGKSDVARIVRELTVATLTPTGKNVVAWKSARTALKVCSKIYEHGKLKRIEIRYYVSSMERSALPDAKWLDLIVLRWGVETCHQILDTAFEDDDRPWIRRDANGSLAIMILRRVAYTILAMYKAVTLRDDEARLMPWAKLMRSLREALLATTPIGDRFRPRTLSVPPAFAV